MTCYVFAKGKSAIFRFDFYLAMYRIAIIYTDIIYDISVFALIYQHVLQLMS